MIFFCINIRYLKSTIFLFSIISIKMEKVLDSGQLITSVPNIQEAVQSQVFCTLHELDKDLTEAKKKEIEERNKMSDFKAFMKKCQETNKKLFPSIFSIIDIKQTKINFQKDAKSFESSSFPLLGVRNSDLIELCCNLILRQNTHNFYPEKDLRRMIKCLSNGYNITSYHSFTHGVSLMHLLQDCFQKDKSLKNLFTAEERNFCMIAAIAHDINHPGTNNAFENKMNTEWSLIAERDATLQKMHVRYLFDIMRKDKKCCLSHYTKDPLLIKQLITRSILSTDITRHFTNLQKMKSILKNKKHKNGDYDSRYVIMENLFHACDIGNPCLPYREYMNWAALVVYEFNRQAELQSRNGVEVTQFLEYKGRKNYYLGQSNFINVFIYPLWKQLSTSWTGLKPFVHNIFINLTKLKLDAQKQPIQDQSQLFIEIA